MGRSATASVSLDGADMELIPLICVVPVLLFAAVMDVRHLRIPNNLSVVALALFVLTCAVLPLSEVGARIAGATIVFLSGFLLFMVRALGGGDVKLMSALMLFIPSHSWLLFAQLFSVSMLVGIFLVVVLRGRQTEAAPDLAGISTERAFPMGISIAMTGISHLGFLAVLDGLPPN